MTLAYHEISEAGRRVLNPFDEAKLLAVGAAAELAPGMRILDLACGKAELLCRYACEFGTTGHGVDLSEVFLAAAAHRADELGVADRVTLELGDASEYVHDAGSSPPFDVGACIGATWIGTGYAADGLTGTIMLLRPAVRPGGLLLIGEPYWIDPPPDEAYDALAITRDEFASLAGTLDRFEAAGTDLVHMVLADNASWDCYEADQWWATGRWLDGHPDDPLSADVRTTRERARRAYLTYSRRYLGWGVFVLRT